MLGFFFVDRRLLEEFPQLFNLTQTKSGDRRVVEPASYGLQLETGESSIVVIQSNHARGTYLSSFPERIMYVS